MYSPRTGQARLALRPSKDSIRRMVETIHELTVRSGAWQQTTELVRKLNRALLVLAYRPLTEATRIDSGGWFASFPDLARL